MVTAANGDDRWLVLAGQQVAGNKGVENIGQTFVLMGGQLLDGGCALAQVAGRQLADQFVEGGLGRGWFSLLGAGVQGQTAHTQQQQTGKPLLHGMPGCQTADGVHGIVLIEVHAEHATGA